MFERAHHQRIERALGALDGALLLQHRCLFGGGTAIALRHAEFRLSNDLAFLVSDLAGYRALRQLLTGPLGLAAIVRPGGHLAAQREIRADQYGIRTWIAVDEVAIKFEIILEGRITLDLPGEQEQLCGVPTLTEVDLVTTKLLANSDRWADDGIFSRDLIDLAMMRPRKALRQRAVAKAYAAYGDSIEADLSKAVAHLLDRPGRLQRCMEALQIALPPALVRQRIRALLPR